MFFIRDTQIAVLEQDVVARFDRSLAECLRNFAPVESQALGEDDLLGVVRSGRQRAAEFGFTNRESIRLYLELMFLLGSGFATDPQYPWASRAAAAETEQGQLQRAGALHSNAIQYLHSVMGPKREFIASALNRLLNYRLNDFPYFGPFPEALVGKLRDIYPEKCAYLGEAPVRTLIQSATAKAERHGLAGDAAPVLIALLMFLLGHEADRDPIHPWVEALLRETAYMEPKARLHTVGNKVWEEMEHGLGRLT